MNKKKDKKVGDGLGKTLLGNLLRDSSSTSQDIIHPFLMTFSKNQVTTLYLGLPLGGRREEAKGICFFGFGD